MGMNLFEIIRNVVDRPKQEAATTMNLTNINMANDIWLDKPTEKKPNSWNSCIINGQQFFCEDIEFETIKNPK